jgi:Protein of unknown function (DUF3822)
VSRIFAQMTSIRRLIAPALSFRDAAFDITHCEKFCLAIQINSDSFTAVVLDNLTNDFLAFEQYQFRKLTGEADLAEQMEKLVAEHEWLNHPFKRTDVMVVTEKFTLVPAALFDSAHSAAYLGFNQPIGEHDFVQHDLLRNTDARLVYAIDKRVEKAIRKISFTARIRHHFTPLIERTVSISKNKAGRRAFVHVQQGRFDLLIVEGANLLLANSFRYQTSEDFIYFLLYSCEQLRMNPEEMEVEIAGEVEADSAVGGLARKYIRNVRFASRPVDARFVKEFEQFPTHYHFNLFALHYFA